MLPLSSTWVESISVRLWKKQDLGSCSVQNQLFRLSMADLFYTANIATIETETVLNYLLRMLASGDVMVVCSVSQKFVVTPVT